MPLLCHELLLIDATVATQILATAPDRDAILPYVKVFQVLIR
jgi:hypothetical protein